MSTAVIEAASWLKEFVRLASDSRAAFNHTQTHFDGKIFGYQDRSDGKKMRAGPATFARNVFAANSLLSSSSWLKRGRHPHQFDARQMGGDTVMLSDREEHETGL